MYNFLTYFDRVVFMPNYILRSMQEKDLVHIVELEKRIFPESPYTESKLRGYFDTTYSKVILDDLLIQDGNETPAIVGYLFANKSAGLFIGNLGVLPEYRGQKLAQRLMNDVLLKAEGENLAVSLQVDKTNSLAIHLYTKFGFQQTGENENHFRMTRNPQFQHKMLIWIPSDLEHKKIIESKIPGGAANKLFLVIDPSRDFSAQLPEFDASKDYQLIVSGGHGNFSGGRPTLLINQRFQSIQEKVNALSAKKFKFNHILLQACFSAGFLPLFSQLSHENGLIYAHLISCITQILPLLNMPLDLISNFKETYLQTLESTINNQDDLVNESVLSECIFIKSKDKVLSINPQNLKAAMQQSAKLSGRNPDTPKDYEDILAFLAQNNIDVDNDSLSLCELKTKLNTLTEAPTTCKLKLSSNASVNNQVQNLSKYSFLATPIDKINLFLTSLGLAIGIGCVFLVNPTIGLAIVSASLMFFIMLRLIKDYRENTTLDLKLN